MMILFSALSPFLLAAALPLFFKKERGWMITLLPLALTGYYVRLLADAVNGSPQTQTWQWIPQFGLNLSFRADGLSLLFALLISGVGALVALYASEYLKKRKDIGRFYFWLLIFMGAMLGVALSDNLILLFVFWELTSLSSFMLIGFEHERDSARASALQALLVTGAGGLAMLAGIVLLGGIVGGYEISALKESARLIQASPLYASALLLILLGAFSKSAQFPFHFWLPNAMEAPTPVSAYLHSATMVKAGVYLMARFNPALGGTELWTDLLGGAGAATMVVGAYLAFMQTDLKKLLAYSTVSALGILTLLIGLGSELAIQSAMTLLLAHGLYKGALFLAAGVLDHETGSRDVTQLGGLFRALPFTGAAALVAALSFAGLPPLFGFVSKELVYETGLEAGWFVVAALFFMGLSSFFVAGLVGVSPFLGKQTRTPKHPHEAPWKMWAAPALLAALSLLFGLAPQLAGEWLVAPAAYAAAGEKIKVKLALWHGINPALGLSVLTVLTGVGLYVMRTPLRETLSRVRWAWGPAKLYELFLGGMVNFAQSLTHFLQSGYLRRYILTAIAATALGGAAAFSRYRPNFTPNFAGLQFYELLPVILITVGALYAATTSSRLGAIAGLGAVGYGVALTYLFFSAPDLAMTQFAIESLTVVLFVLVFFKLPKFSELSPKAVKIRDALIAAVAGGLMTLLTLAAANEQFTAPISHAFVENALLAKGRNVVNVILVDFRGLDTMGEITVLAIAAIGVFALLKFSKSGNEKSERKKP